MSFARWGAESDIYAFEEGVSHHAVCFACLFQDNSMDSPLEVILHTPEECVEHFQAHTDAGHLVPGHLLKIETFEGRVYP